MSDFTEFSKRVHARFNQLSAHELFVVGEDNRDGALKDLTVEELEAKAAELRK